MRVSGGAHGRRWPRVVYDCHVIHNTGSATDTDCHCLQCSVVVVVNRIVSYNCIRGQVDYMIRFRSRVGYIVMGL